MLWPRQKPRLFWSEKNVSMPKRPAYQARALCRKSRFVTSSSGSLWPRSQTAPTWPKALRREQDVGKFYRVSGL